MQQATRRGWLEGLVFCLGSALEAASPHHADAKQCHQHGKPHQRPLAECGHRSRSRCHGLRRGDHDRVVNAAGRWVVVAGEFGGGAAVVVRHLELHGGAVEGGRPFQPFAVDLLVELRSGLAALG